MGKFLRRLFQKNITLRRSLLESSLFLLAYLAWLFLRPDDSPSRNFVGPLATLIPLATAAAMIAWGQARMDGESKRSWFFLNIALLIWLIAGFIRLYYLGFRQTLLPAFSLADIVSIPAYCCLFLAILFIPFQERYRPSLFRFLLDVAISSGVVAVLAWLVIARPAAEAITGTIFDLIPLFYPVADLVLLMILANSLLANLPRRRLSILWGISLLMIFIADYIYSYQAIIQGFEAGGIGELGWIVGYLIFGQSVLLEVNTEDHNADRKSFPDAGVQLQNILPIVLVLVLIWYVLVDWRLRGEPSVVGIWLTLFLAISLIVRLGVRAGEAELNRYYQLFRGLAEPTFICDLNGTILIANPALEDLIHFNGKEKALKTNLLSIFTANGFDDNCLLRTAQQPIVLEVRLIKAGAPFLLSMNSFLTDDRKRLIAGVAYDISEQKQQQSALQKANKELRSISKRLEDLNTQLEKKVAERTETLHRAYRQLEEQNKELQTIDKLKSDFVSMVSHELRTPLTSIQGGLELLMGRRNHNPKDQEAVSLMMNEVKRLSHFVENILNLSSIEAGHWMTRIEPVDIGLIIHDVLRAMRTIPGAERIQVEILNDLPYVKGDENLIHSVLSQLIDNAIKYAPRGTIKIETLRKKTYVRIRVLDDGPGIAAEKRKFLFRPFQRFEVQDSQSVYGHGLGLYLSQQLLASLQSKLHYESSPSGGACFYFDLKAAK